MTQSQSYTRRTGPARVTGRGVRSAVSGVVTVAVLLLAGCSGTTKPVTALGVPGDAANGGVVAPNGGLGNPAIGPVSDPSSAGPPAPASGATAGPAAPSKTAPTAGATTGHTTGGHPSPTVSVVTTAITGSYTGICPPPATATRYRAVITVTSGPVTVTFRWTTANGGDSDPSTQTVTFHGTGRQSATVTHSEHAYPGPPWPASSSNWTAVDLLTPVTAQSNHAPLTINCVPFTVTVKKTSGDYRGSCPPPVNDITFSATITVAQAVDATLHWHLSNNGDSGPNPTTTVHLPVGTTVVSHSEHEYLPGPPFPSTRDDWVALDVSAGSFTASSSHVAFSVACTS